MLDSSSLLEISGGNNGGDDGSAALTVEQRNEGGGDEEGERNSAGSRWPRKETEALLKIRSEMDLAFRDSVLKAPLWDEVSRKLGELGIIRNSKKCKEKFENIYKYDKRTREGRLSRHNGKNYRFFEQLEIFNTPSLVMSNPIDQTHSHPIETTAAVATPDPSVTKMDSQPISCSQDFSLPCSNELWDADFMSASTLSASSSGEESEGNAKKKRKLAHYFQCLMKEVLKKQEDFQKKFLQALEKSERNRLAREEEWKAQEMVRIKREQEFLSNERVMAAAKDAVVLSLLQKISGQATLPVQMLETLAQLFDKPSQELGNASKKQVDVQDSGSGETSNYSDKLVSRACANTHLLISSRWPKAEVEALIMLKTDPDLKYQDNGGKGTVWEEISSSMKQLGYDRNSKRCKEKWENINKYYKRVRDKAKKRPEYSKTCPYFVMLDSLYAKKSKKSENESGNVNYDLEPEQVLMEMNQRPFSPQSAGEYVVKEHIQDGYEEVEQDDDSGDCYPVNDPSTVLF